MKKQTKTHAGDSSSSETHLFVLNSTMYVASASLLDQPPPLTPLPPPPPPPQNRGYCTVLACMLNGEKRAVKIPLATCSDPDGAVADLSNEIRILKRLRHPHLCSVYGAGGWRTEGELPFLVLERLQYKNLAQQVRAVPSQDACHKTLHMYRKHIGFYKVTAGVGCCLGGVLSCVVLVCRTMSETAKKRSFPGLQQFSVVDGTP